MTRIERILCPVDFSESSAIAYGSAQLLARHYHATLLLQHVVELGLPLYDYYAPANYLVDLLREIRAGALEKLHDFAKSHAGEAVQPECSVSEGRVSDSILRLAEEQKANLIVMGTHGRTGVDRAALGSVADKVLRKARCPVLVSRKPRWAVGAQEGIQGAIPLQRILCCTDLSDASRRAWEQALGLAAELGAELTLLHVLERVPTSVDIEVTIATATKQIEDLLARERRNGARIKSLVRIGKAYEQIILCASEIHADVVIMAVRGRNGLDLAVFGSTTYRVIQLGPCSVLAVHV